MVAPRMLPPLHAAWNRGMIDRPSSRSTAAPSTFIATSHTPVPTPLTKRPRATKGTEAASAVPAAAMTRPVATSSAPARTTAAADHRSISQPLEGSAITEPAAIDRSSSPSPPFDSERSARRSGSRATRLAKQRPLRTKTRATPRRARSAVRHDRRSHSSWMGRGGPASSQACSPVSAAGPIASSTWPSGTSHRTTR